jgi:LPXTG-motif cell wall-anchored protein
MTRKLLMLAAGTLMAMGFLASPALAQAEDDGYTPTVGDSTENNDGSVTVDITNCPPNIEYTYRVNRGASGRGPLLDSGSGNTGPTGDFTFTTAPLPNGRHTITVTCGDDTVVLGVNISRGQGAGAGTGNQGAGALPTTGSDNSIPLARLGVILVASGGVALYAGKKRQGRRAAFVNA